MIKLHDLYNVLSAVVPLYVAMILAYGSVRWWRILTPEQCGGINRFVAIFAVPLLSFEIVSSNNPYKMNLKFVLADLLQKVIILAALGIWAKISSSRARKFDVENSSRIVPESSRLDWLITLFMVATLPNTLVMGVPLLAAMYGKGPGSLVVQAVVLQCVIWYTLLLFLYEYRAARILIREQFPDTAASIVSFKVDSDVISLDGRDPVQADAEIGDDGKIHVVVRRSVSLSSPPHHRRSSRAAAGITPRASNLTGAEIYSMHSSRNLSPRHSNYGARDDLLLLQRPSNFTNADVYSLHSSRAPTPRTSNFNDAPPPPWLMNNGNSNTSPHHHHSAANGAANPAASQDHMFVWSSSNSPVSHQHHQAAAAAAAAKSAPTRFDDNRDEFSFGNPVISFRDDSILPPADKDACPSLTKMGSTSSTTELAPKGGSVQHTDMPPARVMTKLILNMVWRKLVRNPNTYSSLVGVVWALVSYRWHVEMPAIVDKSITILSSAGLGMAMFSLGLFMALQKRLLACGTSLTLYGMLVRFVTGPAVMAAASIAVGLRGVDLKVSILQAALPQGIVPFVFAKEYNVHPDILSTAVIFGMLVAFPITLLYYVLLGL